MRILTTLVATITLAATIIAGLAVSPVPSVQTVSATEQKQSEVKNKKEAGTEYKYVAQSGDSYTKMARKAVQTYGKKFKVNLSPAKIIYAETNLTQEAGSPYLEIGQNVNVNENVVKQWVEKAKKLSAEEEQAWNYYVQFVNFNTDGVGVAS